MIIAFSGYARSGKDTAASIVQELYPSFKIKKFSGKLKEVASILTGIPKESFESQAFKDSYISGWDMTGRELLQRLGTEAIRDGLHTDAWVMSLFSDYHEKDCWLITDCRFPNEYEYVKLFGGVVVRVFRNGIGSVNAHPSETALDGYSFDHVLTNDGDIDDLTLEVQEMMKKLMQ